MAARLIDHDAATPGGPPPDAEDELAPGVVLGGRYRIVREMARGGLGAVYEAQHVELERTVAVKVLTGEIARNAEAIRRFQREAQTASQIGHPNIVDVHDLGRTAEGAPFLAMEYLEGKDLDDLLERDTILAPERVIAILGPVASALDAVHGRGIVHRDIKPANIFLARRIDGSEQVKLLDFGLAAFHERGDRLTQVGSVVGTPHYMSPEAAEGELSGPAGDVYSLAAVAYECLCGLLPFDAEQSTGVLVKKVARPAPRMSERAGHAYPEAVEDILALALDRNPLARHPTCMAFIEALSAALEGQPWDGAKPDPLKLDIDETPLTGADIIESGSYDAPPVPQKSRVPLFAGILLLAGLAVGGWLALGPPDEPQATTDPAQGTPTAEEGDPALVETPEQTGDRSDEREPTSVETTADPEDDARAAAPTDEDLEATDEDLEASDEAPGGDETVAGEEREAAPATAAVRTDRRRTRDHARLAEREAPRHDTERAETLSRQAGGALIRGSVARAATLYREATNADPTHAPSWRGLGVTHERMGRAPEAVRAYRRYLRLAPSAADAGNVRARIARLEGG